MTHRRFLRATCERGRRGGQVAELQATPRLFHRQLSRCPFKNEEAELTNFDAHGGQRCETWRCERVELVGRGFDCAVASDKLVGEEQTNLRDPVVSGNDEGPEEVVE